MWSQNGNDVMIEGATNNKSSSPLRIHVNIYTILSLYPINAFWAAVITTQFHLTVMFKVTYQSKVVALYIGYVEITLFLR